MSLGLENRSVLFRVAEVVRDGEDIENILKTMHYIMDVNDRGALGLAAPQIGASKRIIMLKHGDHRMVVLNPRITRRRLGRGVSVEGCLSYDREYTKKRKRDKQIILEGFDEDWEPVRMKLRGLDSYVVQHEIDHLEGITIG